jgi:2-iminobutanoate/2-iminopropanoate deaminase
MIKEIINTDTAPKAIGPYVQAVYVDGVIYTSGQLGIDSSTGALDGGIETQTHRAMKNIGEILKTKGATYKNIIKTTIFVKDLNKFGTVNSIYESYFEDSFPSRSCVEVARLPKDGLVEIEVIAVV